jgi:Sigma-54 interaction domain
MTGSMKLENEIGLARRSRVPVLISAPADRALAVAEAIVSGVPGKTPPVVMCDGPTIVDAARGECRESGTEDEVVMIVREVQNLSEFEQAGLMQLLDQGAGVGRRRIIATSSASLFDRVGQGTFNETLFYRLNAIHIISDAGSDGLKIKPRRSEDSGGPFWGVGNQAAPGC